MSASGGRLYAFGRFTNISIYGTAPMSAKTTSGSDYFVLAINAADGAYIDAGTISGNVSNG